MRDIKFRAYGILETEEEYRMHYSVNIDHLGIPYVGNSAILDHKLMQLTGLTDKNGKEIYECDLMIGKGRVENFPHAVFWDVERAGFVFDGDEVIGNVYENLP